MIRLIGALLLAGGASLMGFLAAGQLESRVKSLRAMLGALELLERELSFRLTPMPALMSTLAERTPPPVNQFFSQCLEGMAKLGEKTLADLWNESLDTVPMDFGAGEKQTLRELGNVLGRYDGEGQCESLALARAQLEQCLVTATDERERMGRVYRMLGLTGGTLMVILLL